MFFCFDYISICVVVSNSIKPHNIIYELGNDKRYYILELSNVARY